MIDGFERRYASVRTIAGEFRQTYRAPGIEQIESGTFTMARPALMRWEYKDPERKLFITDGRDAYLYLVEERQVQIHSFRPSDLHNTPLQFLVGGTDARKHYRLESEMQFRSAREDSVTVRLLPRAEGSEHTFIVLECAASSFDLRRILLREASGNTSEFEFRNLRVNIPTESAMFRFRVPKGVEVVRFDDK